jgi:hypothetical protein
VVFVIPRFAQDDGTESHRRAVSLRWHVRCTL